MKEELSEESRLSLVNYRIDRANETMKEAELLKKEGFSDECEGQGYSDHRRIPHGKDRFGTETAGKISLSLS